ncbi:MAG: trigger factor [Patescibacteria group bacterium]
MNTAPDQKPTPKRNVTRHDNSTVTIEGEIPHEELTKHREAALKTLGEETKLDGFRQGHIPEQILLSHVGEYALLSEMAERALREHYPNLLVLENVDAIGHPAITITKLAAGNPLGFKITTAVMPELKLPDYKKIAVDVVKKHPETEPVVTDEEVDAFLVNILKEKARAENAPADAPAPVITDETAKTLGDFPDAQTLRGKAKEGMGIDKKRVAAEAKRAALLEALVSETKVLLPDILIDAEANKLFAQLKMDLERMKISVDDYLSKTGKTEEGLKKEMRPDAEKRAKIQLVLNEVAKTEKLLPTDEEVKKEVDHLLSHHKDADRHSATLYITTILANEKVLGFLEKQNV